ncbi:MAG: phosphoribosylglycinamide formyltransferase [Lysobacterales bacterium]
MTPLRVVVLISGRGSNLSALIDGADRYQIVAVISNRANAIGLKLAETAGIATTVVDHRDFEERQDFDVQLAKVISSINPELIVLAGFMRVLGRPFVERFTGRMINIHPSLLPDFRGLNTHERALAAGVKVHGASVHFVTAELDGGPVIAQITLPVHPGDTPQTLAERLLPLEHQLLRRVVQWCSEGRITYEQGLTHFDETALRQPLRIEPDCPPVCPNGVDADADVNGDCA